MAELFFDEDTPTHNTLWGEEIVTTKQCRTCKNHYPDNQIYFGDSGKSRQCRKCEQEKVMERYREKQEYIEEYKKTHPCERCGFDNYKALVFHHRDASTKSFELSQGPHRSYDQIDAEIAKCEVLCANCHEAHHYDEGTGGSRPKQYIWDEKYL